MLFKSKYRQWSSLFLVCLASTGHAQSTTAEGQVQLQPDGRILFTGDDTRLSIGYRSGGQWQGELLTIFGADKQKSWLAEGWFSGTSGGVKVGHHWLGGPSVHKVFGAVDQNEFQDRKLTLGYGIEQPRWFANVQYSHGLTGRRLVSESVSSSQSQQTLTLDGLPYLETVNTTLTTRMFDQAYPHGLGVRAGHYWEPEAIRMTLGLDHEWGTGSARQRTLSWTAEKIFVGTPHSMALVLEQSRRSGDWLNEQRSRQAMLLYRFSLGGTHRVQPERLFRQVAQPVSTRAVSGAQVSATVEAARVEPPKPEMREEKRWIKTKVRMSGDAFFELNSAKLTGAATFELDKLVTALKQQGHEGRIKITGHTCDLGSDTYNDRLSLRRAQAVRDYLVQRQVIAAEDTLTEGRGKREPREPNQKGLREKNRRVELEFFSVVDKEQTVTVNVPAPALPTNVVAAEQPVSTVTYEREAVDQPPAWIERALRTPALHKRTVDVYRTQEQTVNESRSRERINRPPAAKDDLFSVIAGTVTRLSVLANDSDPDPEDALTIVSISGNPSGQVRIEGAQLVYTPGPGFLGVDSLTYTIRDRKGLTSTASVKIQVSAPNQPPAAVSDTFWVSGYYPSTLDVLINDTDPDGDALSIVSVTQPDHGTVRIEGSKILFTPRHFFVFDRFTYTVTDGKGGSSTATVHLIDP